MEPVDPWLARERQPASTVRHSAEGWDPEQTASSAIRLFIEKTPRLHRSLFLKDSNEI
jgi:hypothetical protein